MMLEQESRNQMLLMGMECQKMTLPYTEERKTTHLSDRILTNWDQPLHALYIRNKQESEETWLMSCDHL